MEENRWEQENRGVPCFEGNLRSHMISAPQCLRKASGIRIFGRKIKSLAFTTDVAIIRNINTDAIIAVYPFTPQPAITKAIMTAADMPVFVGVGGGVTKGARVIDLARDAEFVGAFGVVLNAPTENETIRQLKQILDIPVVITVVSEHTDIAGRIAAGADIIPIIATGGPTEESIEATIAAGANAITYTPPSNGELFAISMRKYREAAEQEAEQK